MKDKNNEQWLKRDPNVTGKYKPHLIKILDDNVEKSKLYVCMTHDFNLL